MRAYFQTVNPSKKCFQWFFDLIEIGVSFSTNSAIFGILFSNFECRQLFWKSQTNPKEAYHLRNLPKTTLLYLKFLS